MPRVTGTRDSFIEPSFNSTQTDPLRNYPIHDPRALIDYYKTRDVLLQGNARGVPARTQNDVNFAIQREIAKGQGPIASVRYRPWDLVTMDMVNNRAITTPAATSGRFTISTNAAGTFVPFGTHAENSASPSLLSFATEAAAAAGVAVVGLFVVDSNDTDGIVGVYLRGTAATDHLRAEYRTTDGTVHIVTRASSSDTSNANATPSTALTQIDGLGDLVYMSIGLRYDATGHGFIVVLNGEVVLSGTASAGAQALTGNTVGIRQTGAAPGTGVALFQAIDLKVL